jgi:hypothetical protein
MCQLSNNGGCVIDTLSDKNKSLLDQSKFGSVFGGCCFLYDNIDPNTPCPINCSDWVSGNTEPCTSTPTEEIKEFYSSQEPQPNSGIKTGKQKSWHFFLGLIIGIIAIIILVMLIDKMIKARSTKNNSVTEK